MSPIRAIPRSITSRIGPCRLTRVTGAPFSSQWTRTPDALEITISTTGRRPHDVALELLLCVGQALWETTSRAEREAWWRLLVAEIEASVSGEIDEESLRHKRALLRSRASARSSRRFVKYAAASFASTVAEYIHCLWHDVKVRTGPQHLPALSLRRRLETLARWFPPNPGYRLFPRRSVRKSSR